MLIIVTYATSPPLGQSLWRSDWRAGLGSRHNPTSRFDLGKLRQVGYRMIGCDRQVRAVSAHLSCRGVNDIRPRGIGQGNNFPTHWLTIRVDPHLSVIWHFGTVTRSVMPVKVYLLPIIEVSVLLSKLRQAGPLGDQLFVRLWERCPDASPHQQLHWAEVAPRQGGCTVAH